MFRVRQSQHVAPAAAGAPTTADRVVSRTPEQLDQSRAYYQVFLDLSGLYEEHRRRTGHAESPALCAAADRFRRERSVGSLLAFADRLDELDIAAPVVGRKRWR